MVQQAVAGVRYRILFAEAIENLDKNARQTLTGRWSAQIYDYTNNQTLEAAADFPQATNASVTPSAAQPLPSAAEWEEAVEIVRRDEQFRVQLNCNLLIPYRPMPALVLEAGPAGDIPRHLDGRTPAASGTGLSHQIVAVNMVTQRAATFVNGRPDTSRADSQTCGIAPFYCPAPSRGTPGQLGCAGQGCTTEQCCTWGPWCAWPRQYANEGEYLNSTEELIVSPR